MENNEIKIILVSDSNKIYRFIQKRKNTQMNEMEVYIQIIINVYPLQAFYNYYYN